MKKVIVIFAVLLISILTVGCSDSTDTNSGGEDFPEKELTLIVPTSAGGGTDSAARALATEAEKILDQPIGIVNKTGGSGSVGMTEGSNAKPDGYTVTMVIVELTMFDHLGISPLKHTDFKPIGQVNLDPAALTVPADAPYDSLEEFVAYAKEHPGEIKVGNSGTGSIWHISAENLAKGTGIDINSVPFDGAAEAVTGLVGGHIDAVTVSPAEVKAQLDAGKVKTLAVMSDERSKLLPDVPTFEEEGLDIEPMGTWRGLTVPKDTPDEVVATLEDAFLEAAKQDEFEEFMDKNGLGIEIKDSKGFKSFMEENHKLFGDIISDLDIE